MSFWDDKVWYCHKMYMPCMDQNVLSHLDKMSCIFPWNCYLLPWCQPGSPMHFSQIQSNLNFDSILDILLKCMSQYQLHTWIDSPCDSSVFIFEVFKITWFFELTKFGGFKKCISQAWIRTCSLTQTRLLAFIKGTVFNFLDICQIL